jgi:twitching motility protein PilT
MYSQMQVGQDKHGMQTLNQALVALFHKRIISFEEAIGHSQEPDELRNMLEGKVPVPGGLRK